MEASTLIVWEKHIVTNLLGGWESFGRIGSVYKQLTACKDKLDISAVVIADENLGIFYPIVALSNLLRLNYPLCPPRRLISKSRLLRDEFKSLRNR